MLKHLMACLGLALGVGMVASAADKPLNLPKEPCTVVNSGISGKATNTNLTGAPHLSKTLPFADVEIVIKDAKTGKEITRVTTKKDGSFKVHLGEGQYKLESTKGNWSFSHTVKVEKNKWTKVNAPYRYNGPLPPAMPPVKPAVCPAPCGVEGTALAHPVFGNAPTFKVPPTPVADVWIIATDTKTGKEVARVKTDKDGKFRMDLPEGEFKLTGSSGPHRQLNEIVKTTLGKIEKVRANFRYTGPPIPSAGPRK
jgi:5-hydroxyisourate hydrolase-like protein (transthyretin family)